MPFDLISSINNLHFLIKIHLYVEYLFANIVQVDVTRYTLVQVKQCDLHATQPTTDKGNWKYAYVDMYLDM